jgi:cytochrome oxidase Cu insertion factor (SCO1/SenC/PrrC family)
MGAGLNESGYNAWLFAGPRANEPELIGGCSLILRQPRLKIGDRAPAFSLQDQHGREVKLADYLGKKSVVLAFYIKASTGG